MDRSTLENKIRVAFRGVVLGGGRVADAILDRLLHHAHRIELCSPESMRKTYPAGHHDGQSVK